MKSMTGYGRGEAAQSGFKAAVEISSVNRKQCEINLFLPREFDSLETNMREEINRRVSRGRVNVKMSFEMTEAQVAELVRINVPLAKVYGAELKRLAEALELPSAFGIEALVRLPGLIQTGGELPEAKRYWPPIKRALTTALDQLVEMRGREGAHLAKDLKKRLGEMRRVIKRVSKRAPAVLKRYRAQLSERIKKAGFEVPGLEDERLQKEIVYFADRSDISEELTRLESHCDQFEQSLQSGEPVGRALDFLAQEINREINTIGAKANDSVIAREVVFLKTELEKLREQVQNVE